MNYQCERLVCRLGRNLRTECNTNCRRQLVRVKVDAPQDCQDCAKLKSELDKTAALVLSLNKELNALKIGSVEPIKKEEDAAEETPKRKYNKRK